MKEGGTEIIRSQSKGDKAVNFAHDFEEKQRLEAEKIEKMTSIFYDIILKVCEKNSAFEAFPRLPSPTSPDLTLISDRLTASTQHLISQIVQSTIPPEEA